jgi:hypothetical protein
MTSARWTHDGGHFSGRYGSLMYMSAVKLMESIGIGRSAYVVRRDRGSHRISARWTYGGGHSSRR